MSTRWYPIYQKGGPQLRIFLPNFWMKLVRPELEQPPNIVQFACSMEMTKYDIRNYLEKIYNLKIIHVRTRIALGPTKRLPGRGYVVKEDDTKYAYVILPKDEKFQFPELCPQITPELEEYERSIQQSKDGFQKYLDKNKERPGIPAWFTV